MHGTVSHRLLRLTNGGDNTHNTHHSHRKHTHTHTHQVKGYLKALPAAMHFMSTPDSRGVALWQLLPAETPHNELWAGWTRILAVTPRLWGQVRHAGWASCVGGVCVWRHGKQCAVQTRCACAGTANSVSCRRGVRVQAP
jgi:hypothetical protein